LRAYHRPVLSAALRTLRALYRDSL
jgi:hypothetical protein